MGYNCGMCAYFVTGPTFQKTTEGECRRFPPQTVEHSPRVFYFPEVRTNDWCGEYVEKAEEV